jgi:hypothetical protein
MIGPVGKPIFGSAAAKKDPTQEDREEDETGI